MYLVADDTTRRISSGQLVASTRTGLFVRACDEQRRCGYVVIDVESGTRRTAEVGDVDAFARLSGSATITLSPDANTIVMSQWRADSFALLDLTDGAMISRSERIDRASWAADSSGFFTVIDGSIGFVDRPTPPAV